MIRKHLKMLLLTSAVILVPMAVGLLLWDRLPNTMNLHWGLDGQADGAAGKAFAVCFPSLLILAVHWLCVALSARDLKGQSPKAMALTLWICPMLSLVMHSLLYAVALGLDFNLKLLIFVPLGVLFAVMGNYMPKFRRNATMGIKTVWALADDANWNATHRFGGRVWMAAGLAIIAVSCLPWDWAGYVNFILLFAAALAPAVYSWLYHRKQVRSGVRPADVPRDPDNARFTRYTLIFVAVLVLAVVLLLSVGEISAECGDTALTVSATFWEDLTVEYADIDAIAYRPQDDPGSRLWGFGSLRLLLGTFENTEFGTYTRYSYTNPESCIVLSVDGKTLVIADRDAEATHTLYERLLEKIG